MSTIAVRDNSQARVIVSLVAEIFILLLLIVTGLMTAGHYGVASDERVDTLSVFWNIRLLQSGAPIPETRLHYGNLIPFSSELIYQATKLFDRAYDAGTEIAGILARDGFTRAEFQDRIAVKHRYLFIFSLLANIGVAGIVAILAGRKYAWLGLLSLALLPRFWGDSFYNPKDPPFAALFTLGTLLGARLVGGYLADPAVRAGRNRLTAMTFLYGALVGLVSGTRVAGLILIPFVGLAHLLLYVAQKREVKGFLRYWGLYAVMILGGLLVMIALHPASWSNPVRWLVDATLSFSSYDWEGVNLFNGYYVQAQDVPWYYLPMWLVITTPLIFLLLFAGGWLLFTARLRALSPIQRACFLLITLQIGFFPGVAILRGSTIYDGYRQFLFMLPGIAAIAVSAAAFILGRMKPGLARIAVELAMILALLPVLQDMITLHPYEYIYFNRLYGGVEKAGGRFDTDYYGLSMREGMEWVNARWTRYSPVIASRPYYAAETFASPPIAVTHLAEFDQAQAAHPYYLLTLNRFEYIYGPEFAACRIVHQVTRDGVPLTTVRWCE